MENNYNEMMSFIGYDQLRRKNFINYQNADIPKALISQYFSGNIERPSMDYLNKQFIRKYIENECLMEAACSKPELEGFQAMYEEMISTPIDEFEMFTIACLHKELYSKVDNKEFGGRLRVSSAYLEGFPIDLSEPSQILKDMTNLEDIFNEVKKEAIIIGLTGNYDNIFDFIRQVVILKCKLIKIHPYPDGNGRTIRCLINRFFIEAGIPPVYVRENEKNDYRKAMNEALKYRNAGEIDDDSIYDRIVNFYLHKICDSIVQLDIANRVLQSYEVFIPKVRK